MEEIVADVKNYIDFDSDVFKSAEYQDLIKNVLENADNLPDLKVLEGIIYKRTKNYYGVALNEDFA